MFDVAFTLVMAGNDHGKTMHLYDYLSTYITEIVTCMSERQEGTLEETLAVIKDNYDVFSAFMENGKYQLVVEKVLKMGVINLI